MPAAELEYVMYAERWHWTPAIVDDLPLEVEPWLLPIANIIDELAQEKT